jgi:hypothetical protein
MLLHHATRQRAAFGTRDSAMARALISTSTIPPTLDGLGFPRLGIVLKGVGLTRRRSGAPEA